MTATMPTAPTSVVAAVVISIATAIVYDSTNALAQNSENRDKCVNKGGAFSPETRIDACSALMRAHLAAELMPYVFNNRALAFQAKGDYERALADYADAIRLKPNFAHALYNRGTAYQALGEYDRAIDDYTDAIRLDPSYARAYKNRGIAYKAKGDIERANSDFNEASRLARAPRR